MIGRLTLSAHRERSPNAQNAGAASLDVCEQRDVKGLYRRARAGEVKEFTGISSPYEAPLNPELSIPTGEWPIEDCVDRVIDYLRQRNVFSGESGGG